ncbi:MAG TPA: D-aminoacylase [Thermoanaerobaculia bacterium]|nr:D-aminoacylase [Thermoanaerobaculia bacterium]
MTSEDRNHLHPIAEGLRRLHLVSAALAIALAVLISCATQQTPAASYLITGAQIADGTGGELQKASVRVQGDRIQAVGELSPEPGERVIPADGLVLAPGFIDIHNHSTEGLKTDPAAESQVSQGITTLVLGPDGESPWPIAAYLAERRAHPAAVNLMMMVGHATVRELVMGKDFKRPATPVETRKMASLVEQGMREGAAGLSSGLEYEVGSYSQTSELVTLSQAAARFGGFYMTHIRDEADKSLEAFAEAIAIGKQAQIPVQISHIKLGTVGVWGKTPQAIALIEAARSTGIDITADCYPYEAWHANIEVLVPNKRYDDPASVDRALADVGGASHVTITNCRTHPEYAGKNLDEIARSQGVSPVDVFIRVVREGGADVIGHSMKTEDVLAFYRRTWVMVASDGGIGSEHPRGAGTFPKVLGRFVREQHLFSLPEAIRKMTSLPAARLKLSDRGRIAPGAIADLVLFDPATVVDRSTFAQPQLLSEGIRVVIVNGQTVWEDGRATGARPGRVLAGSSPAANK